MSSTRRPSVIGKGRWRAVSLALVLSLVVMLAAPAAFASPPGSQAGAHAPDRILVKFKPGTPAAEIAKVNSANGAREIDSIPQIGVKVLNVPKGKTPQEMVGAYSRNPNVQYAELDAVMTADLTPNDPYWGNQWTWQTVSAPTGWDTFTGLSSVVVAVIDTGVESTHPDLQGRLVAGYDFVNNDADPADDHGHGTAVAGIIGANANNGVGVAGLDWGAKIMPVKALGSNGSGGTSDVAKSLTWSADHGAAVMNLSLGGPHTSVLQDAVRYATGKGAVVVAASGNDGMRLQSYPAAYPEAVAVGALQGDKIASFSNYGSHLDLVAPGTSVYTTNKGGGYVFFSGTSAATPFVAGLAALVRGMNLSLTNAQVVSVLQSTAVDYGTPGWDEYYGWGRIDVAAALQSLGGATPPPAPEPPPAPQPEPTPEPVADTTAPVVRIESPAHGSTVSGSVGIAVGASDDTGVVRVDLYLDGVLFASDTTSPYEFSWNTRKASSGTHTLVAKAYDAAGNVGTSAVTEVTVGNSTSKTPGSRGKGK